MLLSASLISFFHDTTVVSPSLRSTKNRCLAGMAYKQKNWKTNLSTLIKLLTITINQITTACTTHCQAFFPTLITRPHPLATKAKHIPPEGDEREKRERGTLGGQFRRAGGPGGGVGTRKMTVSTGTVISAALPPDEKGPLQPTVPTVSKGPGG